MRLDSRKVKAAREALAKSREKLSADSQGSPDAISVATIKRAENGEPVYLNTAATLARWLGKVLSELLPDQADPSLSVPQRPTIAVLPLRALGGDAGAFADGLAEDIINRLCRLWFPVLGRASSVSVETASSDARTATQALGARYWIEGSIVRSGGRLRVAVQLGDTADGTIVASHTYERPLGEVFALQDELTTAVVTDLSPRIVDAEAARVQGRDPQDLDAWQLTLLGTWHFYRRTVSDNQRARTLLGDALRKDWRMPIAWYALALTHQQDLINQWSTDPRQSLAGLQSVSAEFSRLYPDEAWSYVACAYLDVYQGQRDLAMARLQSAIELDPNTCLAYSLYGQTLAMGGEHERALEQFEIALRLNPRDTERWSTYIGMALTHFAATQYADAVALAEKAVSVRSNAVFAYAALASAHALAKNAAEAHQALQAMLALAPGMSLAGMSSVMRSTDEEIGRRFLEGLRLAGFGA